MYGYIYKTTNKVNNKFYIGQKHSSKFLGNKYLGSGKRLQEAISKYGKESFSVELLEEVATQEIIDEREIYWISYYNATNMDIGYNICEGGRVNRTMIGKNNPFYGKTFSPEVKKHLSEVRKKMIYKPHSEETKRKISEKHKNKIVTQSTRDKLSENAKNNPNYGMKGKHVRKETIAKIKATKASKVYNGTKGYIHITNDVEDKMISKDELQTYLDIGWRKGRKKFSQDACMNISKGHKGQTAHNKNALWINNGEINKTITREEMESYLDNGWKKGMVKRK